MGFDGTEFLEGFDKGITPFWLLGYGDGDAGDFCCSVEAVDAPGCSLGESEDSLELFWCTGQRNCSSLISERNDKGCLLTPNVEFAAVKSGGETAAVASSLISSSLESWLAISGVEAAV